MPLSIFKSWAKKRCLHILGRLDHWRFPDLREDWEGPFNRQQIRQRIFRDLLQLKFTAIVETGTFRGSTTTFMQEESKLPVYSVELYPRSYSFARARLSRNRQIHLQCKDSRSFLKNLWEEKTVPRNGLFFYLDAHWNNDLPVQNEIAYIFQHWNDSVVMIDDFQVPGDEGYKYDDYGKSGKLSLEILDEMQDLKLNKWFPALRSEEESGAKRGCVVLAINDKRAEQMRQIESLRHYGG